MAKILVQNVSINFFGNIEKTMAERILLCSFCFELSTKASKTVSIFYGNERVEMKEGFGSFKIRINFLKWWIHLNTFKT